MARPRAFDEAEVLDRALSVFWPRGYDGAAISDLVDATGLQRQSLYNAFTDKRGLFQAVLARYVAHVEASLAPLDEDRAGLRALRDYVAGALDRLGRDGGGGCLIVKTALGPEVAHDDVRHAVEAGAERVRARFAQVLARAKVRGELADGVDPPAAAAFLYAVLHGLSALRRTGGDERHVEAALDRALASLAAPGARPPRAAPPRRRRARPIVSHRPRRPRRPHRPRRPRRAPSPSPSERRTR